MKKIPGFTASCAQKKKLGRHRLYLLLGVLFLSVSILNGCAAWEDFEEENDYNYMEGSPSDMVNSDGASQSGRMIPNLSTIERMRSSRMTSLNQTPGTGMNSGVSKTESPRSSQSRQSSQPKEDTRTLQAGIESYNIGDYNGAIEKFKKFVDQYPASDSTPEALFFLGESYYRMKEYQQAITNYKKVDNNFSLYPRAGEALFKAGKCLEAMGKEKLAKRVFKKVTAKYPSFKPDSIKD